MDGYTSKKESLCEIASNETPDIITINDTALKGNLKVKISNYFSFSKNREKNKGGVATAIADYLKPNTTKVVEGREDDEYIITRFDITEPALNLVNIYGSQEGRVDKDEIEKSWLRLLEDVKEIEDRNEEVLILGDLNRAVGSGTEGVKGNKDKVTAGGQLIRNMVKTGRYVIVNNLDLVEGGPWTWIDRQDNKIKSCLDLAIVSVSLVPFIYKVIIDVQRKFTPRRVIRRKKNIKTIYTDHFSVKIELKGMPRRQHMKRHEPIWNKGKPGGWDIYGRVTDDNAEKIEAIVEDHEKDIETVMKEINIIDNKTKFIAFGKTKPKSKKIVQKEANNKTQEEKDIHLKEKENEKVERQIERIKAKPQGRAGNVFRIRKDIAGPKKGGQEASAIKDPTTGELLVTGDEIKKATVKYCAINLKGSKPHESVEEQVKQRKVDQLKMMEEEREDTLEIEKDDFVEVIEKFKKKPTKTYDFLIHAGKKYQNSIFKLCKRVIDEEDVPESFRKTTLVMIWKKKGPMSILKNNRFLHMKEVLARTVDALVVAKMKQAIIDSSSIYQVGGLPGHSIHEHLLTLKTVMACKEKKREGFIFLMIDFVSFFDREDIFDCLETMDKINVNKKAKRIWYLLNKGTKIKVKTAHGMTEEEDVGDCLGQGTAGAGLISAANLDIGLQKYFNIDKSDELGKNEEVAMLGKVRIQPIAYQDDIGSICENIEMARSQAQKL